MSWAKPLRFIAIGIIAGLIIHNYEAIINYLANDYEFKAIHLLYACILVRLIIWVLFGLDIFGDNYFLKNAENKSDSSNQRGEQQRSKNGSKKSDSKSKAKSQNPQFDAACQEIGIHPKHSSDQLKRHWRLTCKQWHPDTGGSHALWIRKQYAYEMLLGLAKEREELR